MSRASFTGRGRASSCAATVKPSPPIPRLPYILPNHCCTTVFPRAGRNGGRGISATPSPKRADSLRRRQCRGAHCSRGYRHPPRRCPRTVYRMPCRPMLRLSMPIFCAPAFLLRRQVAFCTQMAGYERMINAALRQPVPPPSKVILLNQFSAGAGASGILLRDTAVAGTTRPHGLCSPLPVTVPRCRAWFAGKCECGAVDDRPSRCQSTRQAAGLPRLLPRAARELQRQQGGCPGLPDHTAIHRFVGRPVASKKRVALILWCMDLYPEVIDRARLV